MSGRPVLAVAMSPAAAARLVTPRLLERLGRCTDLAGPVLHDLTGDAAREQLPRADVLLTGWGCPPVGPRELDLAPRLRAVVHAAGTVRHHLDDDVWARGIAVSSAAAANALPVAEYTLAAVLLAAKAVPAAAVEFARTRSLAASAASDTAGANGAVVGVLSASLVGRRVVELLRPFDLHVLLHDPYVPDAEVRALGAEPVGLAELFRRSDVLTVHAPLLPETRGLVGAGLLARLRDGATLVNTARGAIVDTAALTAEVVAGRLSAVLDVTDPEPLPPEHPLWTCPGAILTPHVAGSAGNELTRLTDTAASEVERWAAGADLAHPVTVAALARTA